MNGLRVAAVSDVVVSSPEVVIVSAAPAHIRELRETIREGDRKEIEGFGFTCAKGLWQSYKNGLMNKTGLIDGKVAAVWGVGGVYMGEIGQPWLLTSDEVRKISPLKFARIYQQEVIKMLELFPTLMNYVAADYPEAVRLLSIVGFDLGDPVKIGKGMYRKFEMVR